MERGHGILFTEGADHQVTDLYVFDRLRDTAR
jgi:hypothetical protein